MDWLFNKTFHHNLSNSSIGAEFKIVENQGEMCYDNVQCALHLNKLIYDHQNLIIPFEGESNPAKLWSKVLLPAPDSPVIATLSP